MKSVQPEKSVTEHVADSTTTSLLQTPSPSVNSSPLLKNNGQAIRPDFINITSISSKTTKGTPQTNGEFDQTKIIAALLHAQDVFERASIPFIVIGNIAYQMKNNLPLSGYKVVFAVMYWHAVPECTSLLRTIEPKIELLTDGWKIMTNQVPVIIKIIPRKFYTFLDPDTIFYAYDVWKIPNPFDEYWTGDHHDT